MTAPREKHASQRLRERYGLRAHPAQVRAALEKAIADGSALPATSFRPVGTSGYGYHAGHGKCWVFEFQGQMIKVIYDIERRRVVTALPFGRPARGPSA